MKTFGLILGVAAMTIVSTANAVTYSFVNISANSVADATIGEAQLSVDVTAAGAGQVSFKFNNVGPAASSITDVYFDDGTLLGIATINQSAGVDFSQGASPGNLPSGNSITPNFQATAGFTADSNPPTQPSGVNPGEWVEIIFNLQGGGTFNDVLAELASGELRIGIHVQGFAGGGSESFVNNGPTTVPDAGSGLMLLGMGLMAVEGLRRRFAK